MSSKKTRFKRWLSAVLCAVLAVPVVTASVGISVQAASSAGSTVTINGQQHTLGVIGSFSDWYRDIPMTDEDGDGIFEAKVSPEPGEYEFRVRADQAWDYSWCVYEPEYDRTQNSQTNCKITVHEGEAFVVRLDTTKVDDAVKANADSYANDSWFDFEEDGYEYWPVTFEIVNGDLTNTSSISARKIVIGNSVTVKCTAVGGNSDQQFTVLYQEPNSTKWKTASAYSTKEKVTFTPTLTGNYTIRVRVKDADGKTAAKDFTLHVRGTSEVFINDELHTLGVVGGFTGWGGYDEPDIPLTDKDGDGIFEAVVSPEPGEYEFKVRADQDWNYSWGLYEPEYDRTQNSQTNCQITVHDGESFIVRFDTTKVDDAAKANADSYVHDSWFDFEEEGDYYWPVTVEIVSGILVNTSSISAKSVELGSSVTVNCKAHGGNGDKQFTVLYQEPNSAKWKTASAYSTKEKVTFKPTMIGNYKIRVRVKEADGKTEAKDFTLQVTEAALKNTSTISEQKVWSGDAVTINCSADNGNGDKQFTVLYQEPNSTKWKTASAYSANSKVTFTPNKSGKYTLRVRAKDADGKTDAKDFALYVADSQQDERQMYFYYDNSKTKWANVYVYWESLYSGDPVTDFYGDLYGCETVKYDGYGDYDYYMFFQVKMEQIPGTSIWQAKVPYGTDYRVRFSNGGSKYWWVYSNPEYMSGMVCTNAEYDCWETYTGAYISHFPLNNQSSLSQDSVAVGNALTIHCKAVGGAEPKQYMTLYQKKGDTKWKTLSAYSGKQDISFLPMEEGVYTIRTKIKDSSGKIAVKDLTLTVKEGSLVNLSTVDAASAVPGDTITIHCAAAGGSGTKQFTVLYQKYGQTNWKTISAYSTKKTVTFKPTTAGDYTIRVRVKDAAGKTVANNYYVSIINETADRYIFFDNSSTQWDEVYAYWESANGRAVRDEDGELYGYRESSLEYSLAYYEEDDEPYRYEPVGYPGLPMQKIPGTNVWQAKLPYHAAKIVFSDGKFYQDNSDAVVYSTENAAFDDVQQVGQVYVPDTTQSKTDAQYGNRVITYPQGEWQAYTGRFVPDNELKNLSYTTYVIGKKSNYIVNCVAKGGFGEKQFAVYYKEEDSVTWKKVSGYTTQSEIALDDEITSWYFEVRVKVKDAAGQIVTKDFGLYNDLPVVEEEQKLDLREHYVGITGSFNNWELYSDVPMYDDDGDGIWEGTVHIDEVTEDMIWEATTDIGEEVVSRGFSGVQCKIRLDGAWDYCWGEYEPAYERTFNSQTNFCIRAEVGQPLTFRVFLDTNQVMSDEFTPDDDDAYYVWRTGIAEEMDNLSTISADSAVEAYDMTIINLGDTLTIDCKAANNAGAVQYMVLYYASSQERWKTLSAYSDKTKVTFKPTANDLYTVRVKAKDAQGNIAVKDFTVGVIKPITNNSALGTNSIKLGSSVAVICSAENGWGDYQYAVYYKKASSEAWTKLRGYESGYVLSLTPKAAVDYEVRVDARDARGNLASTILTLSVTK